MFTGIVTDVGRVASIKPLAEAGMARVLGTTGSGRGSDTQSASNSASTSGSADRMANSTGSTSGNNAGSSSGNWNSTGDVASANNAGSWDKSCFIGPQSTSFVLHTQDGRMIRLDDASNQKIAQQLQSTGRVSSMNKIFRVRVNGSMSGDQMTISDIQM